MEEAAASREWMWGIMLPSESTKFEHTFVPQGSLKVTILILRQTTSLSDSMMLQLLCDFPEHFCVLCSNFGALKQRARPWKHDGDSNSASALFQDLYYHR